MLFLHRGKIMEGNKKKKKSISSSWTTLEEGLICLKGDI
jgi:hypothetical protein